MSKNYIFYKLLIILFICSIQIKSILSFNKEPIELSQKKVEPFLMTEAVSKGEMQISLSEDRKKLATGKYCIEIGLSINDFAITNYNQNNILVVAFQDGQIIFVELETGKQINKVYMPEPITSVAVYKNSNKEVVILVGDDKGEVVALDLKGSAEIVQECGKSINDIIVRRGMIFIASKDNIIRIYDLDNFKKICAFESTNEIHQLEVGANCSDFLLFGFGLNGTEFWSIRKKQYLGIFYDKYDQKVFFDRSRCCSELSKWGLKKFFA